VRPLAAPSAEAVKAISPSGFEAMRACRLRAAFARSNQPSPAQPTAPQLLGTICHVVLETLTKTRAILGPDWTQQLELHWAKATREAAADLAAADGGAVAPPEQWDGYEIKLARLRKAARRLHELLAPLGDSAELITETSLSAADGWMHGRPDLIVRGEDVHWLLDYKTGPVLSRDSRVPRESYVRQLQLYAYLESESMGDWPQRAFLVPLQGPVVEVDIDPAACAALAEVALDLLAAFNAHAPAPQPPSPAPETCRWCPYAPNCPAFWESCDEGWAPTVLAAAGTAKAVTHPSLGGVSVTLEVEAGSLEHRSINVRAISVEDHPAAGMLAEGSDIALVGLRPDRDTEGLVLPESGRAWVWSP
jgi:CRISPR/Cas system-associated exonuclease Cas4 (RecB family)